jgi:hypothetical protein
VRFHHVAGLLLASSLAALVTACGQESPKTPNAPSCTFRVTLQNPTFGPAGGQGAATVGAASGCAWTAASNADWITLKGPANGSGDGQVTFTVAAYDGAGDRSGGIVVAKETLTIAQQACAIQISPAEQQVSDASALRDIDLQAQAGCKWQFDTPPSWITVTPASGEGPARINVRIDNNGTTSPREATLHAGSATLTIKQNAGTGGPPTPGPPTPAACTFGVSPVGFFPHSYGGTAAITVTTQAGCAWTVSTSAAWTHLSTSGGTGPGSIGMTFDPNPDGYVTDFRRGTVEVRWPTPTAGQNVQVSQYGNCKTAFFPAPGATFSAPDTLSFGADGGDAHVFVLVEAPIFGCPWVVENEASPFTLTNPPIQAIQKGDGDLHIAATPNPSPQPRTATIVVGERTFKIVQAGR